VFNSEVEALNFIRRQVPRGTELYADEAGAWNALHARYTLHRINHEEAYSLGGEYDINTNSAESFFSRMRRGEIGHHHHVAGPYLIRFAQEAAWREDHRKVRPLDGGGYELALLLSKLPSLHAAIQEARGKSPNVLSKLIAGAVAASIRS